MEIQLDKWQKDVLSTNGNIVLRSGRQVGKSTVISIKSAEYAVNNAKKSIMIISATERQAYLLFSKVLQYIHDNHKNSLKWGKDRPTKSEIKLKNGSIIRCLPTGLDGLGIRGYTVDLLIADEAAFIPQEVWAAVTPMLATTGGVQILLSTPVGRGGYFYDCFHDRNFTSFHISSEIVAQERSEPQRTWMLEHQAKEKQRMTKLQYAQEYLGEFVDDLRQFFSDEIIKKVQCLKRRGSIDSSAVYFLGVDIARMGEDESTFEILDRTNRKAIEQVESIVTTRTLTTQTIQKIIELETAYKFRKIYIDDGGMGAPVLDQLLKEDKTKRKVEGLNNARRSLDRDETQHKKLMKEDLYLNLLRLMERGEIKLLDDDEIAASLKSVQYEYVTKEGQPTRMRIFGSYTHIAEGLIRAAWGAQDKKLNIWVR